MWARWIGLRGRATAALVVMLSPAPVPAANVSGTKMSCGPSAQYTPSTPMAANSDVRDATWSNGIPVNPTSILTGVRPPSGPYGNVTAAGIDAPRHRPYCIGPGRPPW